MYAVLSCGMHGFGGNAEPQLQNAVSSDVHVRGYALHSSGAQQSFGPQIEPPLPTATNAAAEVCRASVTEIADSMDCTVASGCGYRASAATPACSLGILALITCDPDPCPLHTVI